MTIPPKVAPAKGITIAVVEDNPMNSKLLQQALTIAGYDVVQSSDGRDIVRWVAEAQARAVLMDIQLPGVSGIELLRQLRADERTAPLPVIAVTAFADPASVASFLAAGFQQVATKPISVRRLLNDLADLCQPPPSTSA